MQISVGGRVVPERTLVCNMPEKPQKGYKHVLETFPSNIQPPQQLWYATGQIVSFASKPFVSNVTNKSKIKSIETCES